MPNSGILDAQKRMLEGEGVQTPPPNSNTVSNFSANNNVTPMPIANQTQSTPTELPPISSNKELNEIGKFYGNSRNEYINEQTANLNKAYANQVADLEKAYADAIAEGKMSVRDAEREFTKQKKLLDERNYTDNEGLKVHAQQRGIQNSQQLLGLEMGASARTTSMMREGMSERDLRIADIRDRMDALSTQKKLALSAAQADRDYGVVGATSEANRMYNENIGNMLQQDFFNRQGYEHDMNMQDRTHKFDLEKMDVNQRHVLEQMAKAHGYDLNKLSVEQANTLQQMATQHGYDMTKINQQFQNNVSLDKLKYSHDMNMSEQEFNQAKKMATHNSNIRIDEERRQYRADRDRKLNELGLGAEGENSPEFKIWDAEATRNLNQMIKEIEATSMTEAMLEYGGGSGGGSSGGSGGSGGASGGIFGSGGVSGGF